MSDVKKKTQNAPTAKKHSFTKKTVIEDSPVEYEICSLIEVVETDEKGCVEGAVDKDSTGTFPLSMSRKVQDGVVRQYINLDKTGTEGECAENGRWISFRAKLKWLDEEKTDSLNGKKVKWFYKKSIHNSRGNRPDSLPDASNEGFSSQEELVSTADEKGWTPVVKFYLSEYAGDEFIIHARAEYDDICLADSKIIKTTPYSVWRKFWYQTTYFDARTIEEPGKSIDAYKKICAEMVKANEVKFKKADQGIPAGTFYPDWMVSRSSTADHDSSLIGGHNRSWFYDKFESNAKHPVKGHLILCDYQWDPAGETDLKTHPMSAREEEIEFPLVWNAGILKPALKGDLVVEGQWEVIKTGNNRFSRFFESIKAKFSSSDTFGQLTDNDIIIEKSRTKLNKVKVKLPAACPDPAKKRVVIQLKLSYGKFYAGESNKHQMLIVYKNGQSKNFNQVVSHEFGHGFGQVPEGAKPYGIKKHPQQYGTKDGHGGIGSHCKTGSKVVAHKNYPKGLYQGGSCIMFHQVTPDKCTQTFCADCTPYLRLTDMSRLT